MFKNPLSLASFISLGIHLSYFLNIFKLPFTSAFILISSLLTNNPLTYDYKDNWKTGAGKVRGGAYRTLKKHAEDTILNRVKSHLGNDFMEAVVYYELSIPMTYERYTYSQNGSFIGWSVEEKEYGKYMKQRTDIENLYLVGQWVFPGFGVEALVMELWGALDINLFQRIYLMT